MQCPRRPSLEEDREPDDDRDHERSETPQRQEHEVRDREDQAKRHGPARPAEIVRDRELNRARDIDRAGRDGVVGLVDHVCIIAFGSVVYHRAVPELPVTPADVAAAAEAIRGGVHRTPTFSSRSLGEGQLPEGRAVPADRLVQGPRSAEPGPLADGGRA